MGFLAIANAYTMRNCLSIAITEMVKKYPSNGTAEGECVADEGSNSGSGKGTYEWSESLQGVILASFYVGYVITHIPGGYLADRFGGKYTLSIGILSTALLTLITPICIVHGGAYTLIALRILIGLGEGTTFPALSALLASWIPLHERSKLGALVFGGGQVGTIIGSSLSGVLLDYYDGWSSVFYFFGGMGIVWFILFVSKPNCIEKIFY